MSMLPNLLLVIQVISALSIIVLVLLQQGKGADMGSSFGSGSAGSLFGATGAANFLSRTTKWCAVVFFVTTAGLAYMGHHPGRPGSGDGVMQNYDRSVPQAPGAAGNGAAGGADASVPAAPQAPAPAAPAAPAQPSSETPATVPGAAQQPPAQQGGGETPAQGEGK